jgi:hypothetical protein
MMQAINQNSVFWEAFWAGAASPVYLFSPPTPYVPSIVIYSVADTFAQVGITLTETTAPVYYAGPAEGFEYSDYPGEHFAYPGEFNGEFGGSASSISATEPSAAVT